MSDIHLITERAMIVSLSISRWEGYRLDKEASRKVTEENGAASDAARVNKHLVPKEALADVVAAANAIRDFVYSNTLPWRDQGGRLLSRRLYMTFIEQYERLRQKFDDAVTDFLNNKYPVAKERAAFRMGELFNPADYPSASELRYRFRVSLDIEAIATPNDFRVQLDAAHVERVRKSMEDAALRRVQNAQADVWKRLIEKVGNYAERLATPDAVFRDSLVGNIEDLLEMIPGLNVLDDPDIERTRQEISQKLVGHSAKDIRSDPALRQELSGEAKAIVDKMSGFMRAFGAGDK